MDHLSLVDILDKILVFLNLNDLFSLMLLDKRRLHIVGRSNIWLSFIQNYDEKHFTYNKYRQLCEGFAGNLLVPNLFQIQPYYGEHYYRFIYDWFVRHKFDGYLNLVNVLNAPLTHLKKFRRIIHEFFQEDKEMFLTIIHGYKILRKNQPVLKDLLKHNDRRILQHIVLNPIDYNLSYLTVNVRNYESKKALVYLSNIGYNHTARREFLTLPYRKIASYVYVDKYGIGQDYGLPFDCQITEPSIFKYFSDISRRVNVDPYRLFSTVTFILRIAYHVFTKN